MEKVEVRIIAGTLKGRKLACLVHGGLRPTPQLVREALFSILGDAVPGRPFYDVFAGSGVVGLEAVSRGATAARLIERDAKQAVELQKAAAAFKVADRVQVIRADAYRWAERWLPPADPVTLFLSPPFPDLTGPMADEFLALVAGLWGKLPAGSVLAAQVEDSFSISSLPEPGEWDVRPYARNVLLFRVKGEPAAASTSAEPVP